MISREPAWSYGRGGQAAAQKLDVAGQNNLLAHSVFLDSSSLLGLWSYAFWQEPWVAPENYALHPPLPSSLGLQATLHALFSFHARFYLLDKATSGCKCCSPSAASWWEHETIRAIKKGIQRKVTLHSSAYQFPTKTCQEQGVSIPVDTSGRSSNRKLHALSSYMHIHTLV